MKINSKFLLITLIFLLSISSLAFASTEIRTGKDTFKEIKAYLQDDSKPSIYAFDENNEKVNFFTTHIEGAEFWGDIYVFYDWPTFEENGYYLGVDQPSENVEVFLFDHQGQEITVFNIPKLNPGEKIILNSNRDLEVVDPKNPDESLSFAPEKIEPKAFKQEIKLVTAANNLSDIDGDEWFYDGLEILYVREIIQGYSDGTFKPESSINRAELLKIATLIPLGFDERKNIDSILQEIKSLKIFSDIKSSDWFYTYVQSASEKEIVKGYTDGSFRPAQNITRAEALKILLLSMKIEIPNNTSVTRFSDVSSNDWFSTYIQKADELKLLEPYQDSNFSPDQFATRAEIAYWAGKLLRDL